jgi:acetyl esterase/lipase
MVSIEQGASVPVVLADGRQRISMGARLIRNFMRRFVKNRLRYDLPVHITRDKIERLALRQPLPPADVAVQPFDAGGISSLLLTPDNATEGRHILYLHGGGYIVCSPRTHMGFVWRIAKEARARLLLIDYRLAPEHAFPAQIDDSLVAYKFMLDQGIAPGRITVMGDSAGGGLTFGLLMRLKSLGLPMPGAAVGMSPYLDLTFTGESHYLNALRDPMIPLAGVVFGGRTYLQGADPRHPEASPIYGDASGLPPTFIQCGSDEVLRSDSERMVQNLRAAGVPAELEVWHLMPHVWQAFSRYVPEGRAAIAKIGAFVRRTIPAA